MHTHTHACVHVHHNSPELTWRDVQYLVVYSSNSDLPQDDAGWRTNGAGLKYSHIFGFGVLDTAVVVNRARYWTTVPERKNCSFAFPVADKK